MNSTLRARWLEDLRSGEYPQTYGQLRRLEPGLHKFTLPAPAGYCCLGVLAETCRKLWPAEFEWLDDTEGTFTYSLEYDDGPGRGETSGELQELSQMLGITDYEQELILRNDSGSNDFRKIADYIEATIPADDVPLPFGATDG